MSDKPDTNTMWREVIYEENGFLYRFRRVARHLPSSPRCRQCFAPFEGTGGFLMRHLLGKSPSHLNPNLCNGCEEWLRKHPGGHEATLTMMFADVRGSTALAEKMSGEAFSDLMNRFYTVATDAIVQTDGLIEKFIGDEVAALYFPGFAGADYTALAVEAARRLLRATGHEDPNGPWLSIGAGVHTGTAFVGSLGQGGVTQITAVGDAVNLTARLASSAAAGEILLTDATYAAIEPKPAAVERRELTLKGKSEPVGVYVLKAGTS